MDTPTRYEDVATGVKCANCDQWVRTREAALRDRGDGYQVWWCRTCREKERSGVV